MKFTGHNEGPLMVVQPPNRGTFEIATPTPTGDRILARLIENKNDALLWQAAPRLLAAAVKFKKQLDDYVANHDGEGFPVDSGCIDCTSGTVPDRLNTGRCGYHKLAQIVG